jgi:tetratricopeptide (TPR) repeat protein
MTKKLSPAAALALVLALSVSCLPHLQKAKQYYADAQDYARALRTDSAIASWKKALDEADRECRRKPSAQAFTIKGLAETNLGRWRDAEASFLNAFGLGFDEGERWASDAALVGLAVSFETFGLEAQALQIYGQLVDKSGFKPVLMTAAEKRTNLVLARSVGLDAGEKARTLAGLNKTLDRLIDRDYACGLYHYLHAQVDGHIGDLRRSYEEAVMARELGLPWEKILRDNDNQLAFCYVKLKEELPAEEGEAFAAAHAGWAKKWGWRDDRTPAWKKE